MKLDIVIPCYNAERYLAQTIGSALEQTLAPRQIIVVDDGSTDGSLAIAREFEAACYGQVRVHSEHSGNAARTRNIGASLSDADALMFLDADDVLAPDALAALADALMIQPHGLAACPWRRLKLVGDDWMGRPATCAPRRPGQDALAAWLTGWYHPPCALLWSRTAFLQAGQWDEDIAMNQDGDLVMRALAYGFPLEETSAGMAYYRALPQGEVSLSSRKTSYKGLHARLTVIEKVCRILEESGRINRYRGAIAQALASVEKNAAGHYAGLWQQARLKKRQYAPAIPNRFLQRLEHSRETRRANRPLARTADEPEPVCYGLTWAGQISTKTPGGAGPTRAPHSAPPQRPAVSVIIPVYNRAHILRRTLDSVLAQTFSDFEVLIVDDGSKDNPAAVVEACGDPRLHYLQQPENQGVAAARNRGLREAKGEFIAFLDDDDEWFPDKLALQVALFRHSSADMALVYTGVETLTDHGETTTQIPSARGDLYRELLVRNIFHGGGSNIMIRRNVIARVGFFDENLPAIEDYDYWLRITRWYKADVVSTPLIRYNDFRDPTDQSSESQERRSLNIQANLAARARFFEKYGAQMRAEGLAHLFLISSARRSLDAEWRDIQGARRLAFQAFLLSPTSWGARDILIRTCGLCSVRNLAHSALDLLGRLSNSVTRLRSPERGRR